MPSATARNNTRIPLILSFSQVGAWVTRVTRSSKSARSTIIETRSESAIIRRRRFGFSAAQVERNCSRHAFEAPRSVSFVTKAARSSKRIWRPAIVAQ